MANLAETLKRYEQERSKRLRKDANAQYTEISLDERYKHFGKDPWADPAEMKDLGAMFPDDRCKVLILGAGWSGLLFAVRMVDAGIPAKDIRIVDPAGGFGGTWYWNKYPGLMCDVESYIYLPLLEETGYIPPHRYAYGGDIQNYATSVAEKWNLSDSAVFQTEAKALNWADDAKEWTVKLSQERPGSPTTRDVRAQFVVLANGVLHFPKLPDIPGILDFKGTSFHTSRWNYDLTGGSPTDASLTKLKDKRVALIGTGVTTVQLLPHLARWAKHVYVVQRTPASVDIRGQRETDKEWFRREVAQGTDWQRERKRNFNNHFTTGAPPDKDLVNDGWTNATAMTGIVGNKSGPTSLQEIPGYIQQLHMTDITRQDRIRARVKEIVKDPETASKLQPQYATWCKRPGFHDEYLQSYNQENVTLIDTDGKGLDRITEDAIVLGSEKHAVDMIIYATGYRSPNGVTPADRANLSIIGRDGISMTETWQRDGPSTLHGLLDANFPNLLISGISQGATGVNFLFHVDEVAKHAAYILTEAQKRAESDKFTIAPDQASVQAWAGELATRAFLVAGIVGCTPSYASLEGGVEQIPPEQQLKAAKSGIWGHGVEDYVAQLEAWREKGGLQGIEIQT